MQLDDEFFDSDVIFLEYDFEEVMYRWDRVKNLAYVKFHGEEEKKKPILTSNRLFTDALRFGKKISRSEYESK